MIAAVPGQLAADLVENQVHPCLGAFVKIARAELLDTAPLFWTRGGRPVKVASARRFDEARAKGARKLEQKEAESFHVLPPGKPLKDRNTS